MVDRDFVRRCFGQRNITVRLDHAHLLRDGSFPADFQLEFNARPRRQPVQIYFAPHAERHGHGRHIVVDRPVRHYHLPLCGVGFDHHSLHRIAMRQQQ